MNVHKLLVAAKEGRQEEIAELLAEGLPIDRRRPFFMKREKENIGPSEAVQDARQPGMTALMYAAQSGYPSCCARLLVGKANVNAEDEDGTRPLHFAASSGRIDLCRLLIEYNADVHAITDDGKAAVDFVPDDAIPTAKHYQMWRTVLQRSPTDKVDADKAPTPPTQTDGSGDAKSEANSWLHEQEFQHEPDLTR